MKMCLSVFVMIVIVLTFDSFDAFCVVLYLFALLFTYTLLSIIYHLTQVTHETWQSK